jgi:hypothetical protein
MVIGMTSKIGTSQIELDSTKVILEDEKEIVIPALLAREAVLPYAQGKAFRPREELKSSLFTFDGAWCVSKRHPEHMLVTKPYEISGKVSDVQWDEARALVKGNVHLLKAKNDPAFIQDVKDGRLKDVSIGFIYEEDWTPGKYQGQPYDFVQRNLLINHVAVGVPRGRMTSPQVGLGLDSALAEMLEGVCVAADPWEENDNTIRSGHGPAAAAETCRTKVLSEAQGISLVVCRNKDTGDWYDQSFLFAKAKDWTMEKAKAWFSTHKGNDASEWYIKAEVDEFARTIGVDSFGDASFPDECFFWVPEEAKGPDGKKSLRKLPYKFPNGTISWDNVYAAIRYLPKTEGIPPAEIDKIRKRIEAMLKEHNPDYKPSTAGDSAPGSSGSAQVAGPGQAAPPPKDKGKKEILSTPDLIARNKRIRDLAGTVL